MAEWLERVVASVTPQSDLPVVAIDPEGLLLFPEIQKRCVDKGFTILLAKPGIDARVAFEIHVRGKSSIILVIQGTQKLLPDIQIDACVISVSYGSLFPFFDAKALSGLGYNALCTLDTIRPFEILGFERTVQFLLENLYSIDFDALKKFRTKERILAVLIDVLFHSDSPNSSILNFLKQIAQPFFGDKTEELLVKETFVVYLKNEWEKHASEQSTIDFTDPILSKVINALFIAEIIPVKTLPSEVYNSLPVNRKVGYRILDEEQSVQRITELCAFLRERIATIQNQRNEWFELGPFIGELGVLVYKSENSTFIDEYTALINKMNARFQNFITNDYSSLHSLSGIRRPATVHKILDYIHAQNTIRKALFVIDGMNLWQWHILKKELEIAGLKNEDMPCFAWLPSITAWSRQSLFKGAKPDLCADNSKESSLFSEYWIKKGNLPYQISFAKFAAGATTAVPGSDIQVAGFICNDLDNLMHGAIMGNTQLLVDTETWVRSSGVVSFLTSLAKSGFTLYISTDHGNIEATGNGGLPLSIRNLSKSRGKRHIQFVDEEMAKKFLQEHPLNSAKRIGASIYLSDESAFIKDGTVVTHGGSHIMELMIPLGVIR